MKLFLDWSHYENAGLGDAYADIPKQGGDYAKAVAACISSRQCEQAGKGVMCPSYRVTGNSALSPGGRVKLLKTALNADDAKAWENSELAEAMDLCVSCKGCKRECENEVDMALIKAEYLAQRRIKSGLSPRNYLWAHLPKLLRLPLLGKLCAYRNRHPWLAHAAERWLGVASQARLPEPVAKTTFKDQETASRSASSATASPQSEEVLLFIDTFNRNFNPAVAEAAFTLLAEAGYQPRLLDLSQQGQNAPLCCGRTYFANGMIAEAKREASRLLQALQPHLDAGRWIIGLEPSCILSLRDEYLKLGFATYAKKLADRVLLLEEFIAREQTAQRWPLNFKTDGRKVLVHGHCHQKAVGAMKAMRKVLKSVQGLDFDLIEASCCGMAGHFGLEAEHYGLSQAMAEQALFPALRAMPHAAIVANGFSCQLQIDNGGFGKPLHIAEILLATLINPKEAL